MIAFANGDISPDWRDYWPIGGANDDGKHTEMPFRQVAAEQHWPDHVVKGLIKEYADAINEEARERALRWISQHRELARETMMDASRGIAPLVERLAMMEERFGPCAVEVSTKLNLVAAARGGVRAITRFSGPFAAPGWIQFCGLVLVDDDHVNLLGGRTDVGFCKWRDCGRFFRVVVKGRGKPARDFCSPEHRDLFHSADSTRRVNEMRERVRRANETKPRRRRPSKGK